MYPINIITAYKMYHYVTDNKSETKSFIWKCVDFKTNLNTPCSCGKWNEIITLHITYKRTSKTKIFCDM